MLYKKFTVCLFILFLISLISCKSYEISTKSFKKQFPYIKDENQINLDSSYTSINKNHNLDSIKCLNSKKIVVKLNIKNDYLIKINYTSNKFWQTTSHAFINPNFVVYSDSNIISVIPFYIGVFQHKRTIKIPLLNIQKIKLVKYYNKDMKFSLKLSPLALINLYEGYSARAGFEFKLVENISLNIEMGKYLSLTNRKGTGNGSGFSFNPELRYYLNRKSFSVGKYLAVGYMYKNQTYFWSDSIKLNSINSLIQYDVISKINIFNIKYGITKVYKSKLILDYFFGFGIQYRTSVSSLSQIEQNSIIKFNERGYYESKVAIGKFMQPSFHVGLKIGILLW